MVVDARGRVDALSTDIYYTVELLVYQTWLQIKVGKVDNPQ